MTTLRTAAQQALEALYCGEAPPSARQQAAADALRAALAEPTLQTCNCRWDGEVQVQQCTLHEAHVDAIHEWAERAKTAEKKLAALAEPVQEQCKGDTGECEFNGGCMYACAKPEPVQEPDYWQEEARRYAGNADYWRKRYEALAEPGPPIGKASTDVGVPVYVVKKAEPPCNPSCAPGYCYCDGIKEAR